MRQSELFTKTQKDAPKDEVSANAELLARGGFTDKLMAGVYTYLPLGWRVLKKIENIIREEMERAGGQEILMPSLQPKENWEKTGRWDTMDDLYKVADQSKKEFALGPTHEEIIVPLARKFISSYKDLPLYLFQIQNKFRMELRAKSGMLRGREFLMKDLYSFHKNEADLDQYYEKMKSVYSKVFERAGIGDITYLTFASGGSFSKYSHEFQTVTPAGEDIIYLCESCHVAVNKEIIDEQKNSCPQCGNRELTEKRSIEVGNIFNLKTRFSDAFGLVYRDEEDKTRSVLMGCYGIGLGRLLGTIVEVHHDAKGIIWPEQVAPYFAHLINIASSSAVADNLYGELSAAGVDILYDDRAAKSAGEKFADADLLGVPYRIVVSDKTIQAGKYEIKKRSESEARLADKKELLNIFQTAKHHVK